MFGWIRRSVSGKGKEKHWGSICGFVLGQDEFADLRQLEPIFANLQDGLGDSVSHIADGGSTTEQAERARLELMACTKGLGLAKRFVFLSPEERRALALEYWPGQDLSEEAAIKAANTNHFVLHAKVICLSMILNDIVKPKKEDWWFEYLVLVMADPESPVNELAEIAIMTGNGLGRFSAQLARAKIQLKDLSTVSRSTPN